MSLISDEQRLDSIVALTAEFRYRLCWMGARSLLRKRGIDPMRVLQLSCDQGSDVNTSLMLPDGLLVNVDFNQDPSTRELVSIHEWEVTEWCDHRVEMARQIVTSSDTEDFDRRVEQYFLVQWRGKDAPLPLDRD